MRRKHKLGVRRRVDVNNANAIYACAFRTAFACKRIVYVFLQCGTCRCHSAEIIMFPIPCLCRCYANMAIAHVTIPFPTNIPNVACEMRCRLRLGTRKKIPCTMHKERRMQFHRPAYSYSLQTIDQNETPVFSMPNSTQRYVWKWHERILMTRS